MRRLSLRRDSATQWRGATTVMASALHYRALSGIKITFAAVIAVASIPLVLVLAAWAAVKPSKRKCVGMCCELPKVFGM
jgi:hypothetical protein